MNNIRNFFLLGFLLGFIESQSGVEEDELRSITMTVQRKPNSNDEFAVLQVNDEEVFSVKLSDLISGRLEDFLEFFKMKSKSDGFKLRCISVFRNKIMESQRSIIIGPAAKKMITAEPDNALFGVCTEDNESFIKAKSLLKSEPVKDAFVTPEGVNCFFELASDPTERLEQLMRLERNGLLINNDAEEPSDDEKVKLFSFKVTRRIPRRSLFWWIHARKKTFGSRPNCYGSAVENKNSLEPEL